MAEKLILTVDGMDCPSCASKIEGAVCSLPGVEKVSLTYTTQKLKLDLGPEGNAEHIKNTIKKLGYGISESRRPIPPKPWWQTAKGRLAILAGALLASATLLSFFLPAYAGYVYATGALLALYPLARKALASALAGQPFTIETLVTIAVIGAIVIEESAEAAVVVFLFLIGELLEMTAAAKARSSVQALTALVPKSAFRVEGDSVREVDAESLDPGDIIEIKPGARIPADGALVQGETAIDESSVTGESMPVHKATGDPAYAGSINTDGLIRLRVTRESSDNMIARILQMVEEAEASKAPTARFIDRFSKYYTPGVLLVAALIAFLPPLLTGASLEDWTYKGLAILLIGCPCALVLSTPAAITSGISSGARQGLLIKGGAVLEAIGKVGSIAFDKTGTLTTGTPQVTDLEAVIGSTEDMLTLAASVEAGSTHPLAKAIVTKAEGLTLPPASQTEALQGWGMRATIRSATVEVISPRYAAETADLNEDVSTSIAALEAEGKTVVIVRSAGTVLGFIAMRDELRDDAASAIGTIEKMGIKPVMLTGDNKRTGEAVAKQVGIAVHAELMPDGKMEIINQLQHSGPVAMVGDGINDAPALAHADVGIAMGQGTDVALETADAALLHARVSDVPALVALSRTTMNNIYQNISIALGLKLVFLVTTLLGTTSLWMAIMADTGATVLVTLNALRLLGYKWKG